MSICKYCMHSEARDEALYCYQWDAKVQKDDSCPVFERAPGVDDDLEGSDEQ